jgi:hypothetical protein
MNERDLGRLLGSGAEDSGCDVALSVLDQYVEAEIEGSNVLALWPTVAQHLQNCDACREDREGLIALTRRNLGA